jgi:hypothetical protein
MMPSAFRWLVDNHWQLAIAGYVGQKVEGGIGVVSGDQLLPQGRDILASAGEHVSFHPRNLAWIISAKRMLSAIFE